MYSSRRPRTRSRSRRLNLVSRPRTCWLTADCVTKLRSAACEKLRVSTRSQKILSVSICIAVIRLPQFPIQYFSFYLICPPDYNVVCGTGEMATVRQDEPRGWQRFAAELTLGVARARRFALGGLGCDGGHGDAWVE